MLLGTSIPEAAFHLYHRYRQVNRHSREQIIPLIQSSRAGDKARETEIRRSIAEKLSELLADLFHTVYCLANDEFPDEEKLSLERVDMTELFPIEYPGNTGGSYGWTPIVKGHSLRRGKAVPLMLMLQENGEKKKVTFKTGLGTGANYEYVISYGIPRRVYQQVDLAVGLHAELGERGNIKVVIKLDAETLFEKEFKGSSEGARVVADVSRGGMLRLIVRCTVPYKTSGNHVVWGEPFLLK